MKALVPVVFLRAPLQVTDPCSEYSKLEGVMMARRRAEQVIRAPMSLGNCLCICRQQRSKAGFSKIL